MGHWRQPVLLFILPKKPQEMNDFSSFLAVFFYGLMSQSLFDNYLLRPKKNDTTATKMTAPIIAGTMAIPATCGPQVPKRP